MSSHGPAHPLDVELADVVDGNVDQARGAQIDAHLADCLLCRIKCQRLRDAPPVALSSRHPSPPPAFVVPAPHAGPEPSAGQLWLAGDDEQILVLVLRVHGDRALVAPVTFDVEAADDETVVLDAGYSPLGAGLAIYPALAAELPRAALVGSVAAFATPSELGGVLAGTGPGVHAGPAIAGPSDPRLDVRQYLADRLGAVEEVAPDPGTGADAPAPRAEQVRSTLIRDLRVWRGKACAVRPLSGWQGLLPAHHSGWEPIAAIDEVGVVLIAFDTPHGLVDDRDFDAARSVLTRFNATALVVLARAISELAEVFDASSLNYGIDAPSGARTPPRPLISGLTPVDAIAKYLDQHTGARAIGLPSRGPVSRVDVGDILHEAAAAAIADAVKQGSRFKIAPKRRGYESLADAQEGLESALGRAFTPESLVPDLLDLARRDGS